MQSKDVLRAYGIVDAGGGAGHLARRGDRGGEAGSAIPVVLKAVSDTLTHKSDVGAVALNLATPEQLTAAYQAMAQKLRDHVLAGMLVCQQVRGGLELVLGLHRDPEMGLVVMAGAGGVLLELTKDVAFGAPPISREKALDMLARTRAGKLLQGYRGGPPLDRRRRRRRAGGARAAGRGPQGRHRVGRHQPVRRAAAGPGRHGARCLDRAAAALIQALGSPGAVRRR